LANHTLEVSVTQGARTIRITVTSRGQTVIPAAIRSRLKLSPAERLELILEQGRIRVIPVLGTPSRRFLPAARGRQARLLAERQADGETK
jgi:AbrB family looped-hinge helix DNA binding protein